MKKSLFRTGMLLNIILLGMFSCTIDDNNGTSANPGDHVTLNEDEIPFISIDAFGAIASGDTAIISFTLYTDTSESKVVSGGKISVTITGNGTIISPSTGIFSTTGNGKGTITFTNTLPDSVLEDTTILAITYGDITSSATILTSRNTMTLQQHFIVISASPYVIKADGISSSTIYVKLKDGDNNPIVNEAVIFKSTAGLISKASYTSENGVATATLISERRNLTAFVTATIESDTSKHKNIGVVFIGVELTQNTSKESIVPNGVDTTVITATLVDAAKDPIFGEKIAFQNISSTIKVISFDTTTDIKGEAKAVIVGTGVGKDSVVIKSAGDSVYSIISYSSNSISIDTSSNNVLGHSNKYVATDNDSTYIEITYFNSKKNPIPNALVEVSVTAGTLQNNFFTMRDTTNENGKIKFFMKNPNKSMTVVLTATAYDKEEKTTTPINIYFGSDKIARLVLTGSPEVLTVGGDIANLQVIALDSMDNYIKGARIALSIVAGQGGGEYLDPPVVTCDDKGKAISKLVSGSSPSQQHGIKIVASDFSGHASDTAYFTISGSPAYVTIRSDIDDFSENENATYSTHHAAIVTDINRNPVEDSTLVHFSAAISGYIIFKRSGGENEPAYKDTTLDFEDINNNFIRDTNENLHCGYPLYRGEDIVWFENDRIYDPGPKFIDINCNGRRDYNTTHEGYEYPEPNFFAESTSTMITEGPDSGSYILKIYITGDYNNNAKRDIYEPLVDTTQTDAEYEAGENFISDMRAFLGMRHNNSKYMDMRYDKKVFGYPDRDWNDNNVPDPATTILIPRTIPTINGVAFNKLTYGQSDAWRLRVKIWVECEGVVSMSPEEFKLPLSEDDAEDFRPLDTKKYY